MKRELHTFCSPHKLNHLSPKKLLLLNVFLDIFSGYKKHFPYMLY